MSKLSSAALAFSLSLSLPLIAPAAANEPGLPRGEKLFGRLDANSDGRLRIEEIRGRAERRFMRLDGDGDDKVSRAEIDGWLQKQLERRRARILERMDFNKDGAVARGEVDDFLEKLFATADSDHDGGVTLAEAQAYHAGKAKRASSKDRGGKPKQP